MAATIIDRNYLVSTALKKTLVDNIPRQSHLRVLDIGCGDQPYRHLFNQPEYIGLDLVAGDVHGTGEALPFKDNTFDVVLSTQVLEHVSDPMQFLSEARRVLVDGGLLILSTHGVWPIHGEHDYWRWTAEGLYELLSNFREVRVIPNGKALLCICQLLALCLPKLAIVLNIVGRLDFVQSEHFVINYTAIGRR